MGSISIRRSIRWLPDEASEPTSTIVLTSPKRTFVDLRIFKTALQESQGTIGVEGLEWGIAGTSSSTKTGEKDGKEVTRGRWVHWIDSRHEQAPADEGDMVEMEEAGLTLETGHMVNPETGRDTDYEEIWEDEEPVSVPGSEDGLRCVVTRMEDEREKAKGMMVLLGRRCQGISRVGDAVEGERWACSDEDSGWSRTVRIGGGGEDGGIIPCGEILDMVRKKGGLTAGKVIEKNGRKWEVVEVV